ncbi:TetR-like C-terminal domain-containing protein [Nocardia amamiensis]|uniref:TetR-like C-terminal domain-containing protein n=1 Tax=Nocardia TaxID=1817 RepID=UPI00340938AE
MVTKPQLIAAALRATGPADAKDIDTGSLRGDLVAMADRFVPRAQQDTALIAALDHAIITNPDLAATLRAVLLEPDTADLTRFINRAVERGELPARPPAAELLSPLVLRRVRHATGLRRFPNAFHGHLDDDQSGRRDLRQGQRDPRR